MKKLIAIVLFALAMAGNVVAAPTITVGFSRGEPTAKAVVLQAIADAQKTLHIAAYQFTSPDIIRAVIAAHKRGVKVSVVLDRTQANGDSQAALVASGIDCRIDTKYRILHHKISIVDGKNYQTGSFNYSVNADKVNAENAAYIKGDPGNAAKYLAQWKLMNSTAVPCKGGGQ